MPNVPDAHPVHSLQRRTRFSDRLLAESAAAWEQLERDPIDDRAANDLGRAVTSDLESRLLTRARALPIASSLTEGLRHTRAALGFVAFAALILALLAGGAAARAALGAPRDEPVNVFHVFTITLLPQTILLVAWLLVMFMSRSAAVTLSLGSLGGLVLRIGQWISQRIHPGRAYQAAAAGLSRTMLGGSLGRWTFSALSHAFWLAFNAGCLGMLMFLLSTRQYAFGWETTILSQRAYTPLTRAVAALPKAAGFAVPTDEQIEASQWRGEGAMNTAASQAWAGLLVGSLMLYGFAPRILLLGLSLGQRRGAKRRYRLDVERPEFARLRGVLEPPSTSIGVIDAAESASNRAPMRHAALGHPAPRPAGLPAIVGFELPPADNRQAWPPHLHGTRWHDLGIVDSRDQRQFVIDELARSPSEPSTLLVVCALTTTPDRGVAAFLAQVAGVVSRPPLLALTGGHRLRERSDAARLETRVDDWRRTAASAGIPVDRVLEIDFDHVTHSSLSRLASMLGDGSEPISHERRLEQAFRVITDFARARESGDSPLDAKALAALHQQIAQVYGDQQPRWRAVLRLSTDAASLSVSDLRGRLSAGAERFTSLLPDRLKRSPKWLAAGAMAGALACVAAATTIAPVAIAALPLWSGIGAAIAAIAQPALRGGGKAPDEHPGIDLRATVRSAALFAMLLELQGYDESLITRVLDQAVVDGDDALEAALDAEAINRWLNDLRHHFDLALARELRS